MKLKNCEAANFGSYKNISFNFQDQSLSLIHGPTGAGKSTVMDLACWCLFGITAKGGSADEVRSWQSPYETTEGWIEVDDIKIYRKRSKSSSQNDLYWTELDSNGKHRGKDLTETQKLISQRLKCDAELYLTSAYFSDFSPTASFFNRKPASRRETFEKIANLEFPVKLSEKTSVERKSTKTALNTIESLYHRYSGQLQALKSSLESFVRSRETFTTEQEKVIKKLQTLSVNFDKDKQEKLRIISKNLDEYRSEALGDEAALTIRHQLEHTQGAILNLKDIKCTTCGSSKQSEKRLEYATTVSELKAILVKNDTAIANVKSLSKQYESLSNSVNPYKEQVSTERTKSNPFTKQEQQIQSDIADCDSKLADVADKRDVLNHRISSLNHLYDLSLSLRGELLKKSVSEIEYQTNKYLEKYFDAELRVGLTLDDDSLETSIQKSGYEAAYHQLSKGQRGLLRLCFGVSVMEAAANRAGQHFNVLMFDESLDGLDDSLKVKAFALFEELATRHESVVLIDHCEEFKGMFSNKYEVTLEGDTSCITQE